MTLILAVGTDDAFHLSVDHRLSWTGVDGGQEYEDVGDEKALDRIAAGHVCQIAWTGRGRYKGYCTIEWLRALLDAAPQNWSLEELIEGIKARGTDELRGIPRDKRGLTMVVAALVPAMAGTGPRCRAFVISNLDGPTGQGPVKEMLDHFELRLGPTPLARVLGYVRPLEAKELAKELATLALTDGIVTMDNLAAFHEKIAAINERVSMDPRSDAKVSPGCWVWSALANENAIPMTSHGPPVKGGPSSFAFNFGDLTKQALTLVQKLREEDEARKAATPRPAPREDETKD
jgi:hypothetical protein